MNYLNSLLHFTQPPNILGFCGTRRDKVYRLLDKEVWTSEEVKEAKQFFESFSAMNAYLFSIAKFLGKNYLNEDVINAYLIGWDLWETFDSELLKNELKQISMSSQLSKINDLPAGMAFTHNFHVLYFGAVVKDIPGIQALANSCKVSLGAVINTNEIRYNKLLPDFSIREAVIKLNTNLLDLKKGDRFFFHYKNIFKKATPSEIKLYEHDLFKVLDFVNNA